YRSAKREQPKPEPASRACTRRIAMIAIDSLRRDIGQPCQCMLQSFDLPRHHTFLRTKDAGRTALAEKRIAHIARRRDTRQREISRAFDSRELNQLSHRPI